MIARWSRLSKRLRSVMAILSGGKSEMFWGTLVVAVLTAQGGSKLDGVQIRRIYEASLAAESWARWQSNQLKPTLPILQSTGSRRVFLQTEQANCRRDLTYAAYQQICDAYHVSRRTFRSVVDSPSRARSFPYSPDVEVDPENARNLPEWMRKGTLFAPGKVRLTDKLAKRYGYMNPRKPTVFRPNPLLDDGESAKADDEPPAADPPKPKPKPNPLLEESRSFRPVTSKPPG